MYRFSCCRVVQKDLDVVEQVVFCLCGCNWREVWDHSCSVSHPVPLRLTRLSPPSFRPPSPFFLYPVLSFLRKYASVAKKQKKTTTKKNTNPLLFPIFLIILQKLGRNSASPLLTPQCTDVVSFLFTQVLNIRIVFSQNFSRVTFKLIR